MLAYFSSTYLSIYRFANANEIKIVFFELKVLFFFFAPAFLSLCSAGFSSFRFVVLIVLDNEAFSNLMNELEVARARGVARLLGAPLPHRLLILHHLNH
jgi:hypothetical protein